MSKSESVLKRLYLAAGTRPPTVDAELATDVLAYISRLEHALRGDLRPMGFERLLLILGEACGALGRPNLHAMMVDSLRNNALSPAYIASLRDQLSEILDEAAKPFPARKFGVEGDANEMVW